MMIRFLALLLFVSLGIAEDIDFSVCGKDASSNCDVNAVRLSPCPKVSQRNPCTIRQGASGDLQFDFLPTFEGDNLQAHLYWVNSFNVDIPLPGMDTDGCHSTHCPTTVGKLNTFAYNLTIEDWFPPSKYNVKCLLEKDNDNRCCFEFTIKIAH